MKKSKIGLLSIIGICLLAGLFFKANPAKASVACNEYKEHRKEFRNETDKKRYWKMYWLQNHDKKIFFLYRNLCKDHKLDSKTEFEKLSPGLQKMCKQYFSYRGYADYLYYKNKCHDDDDDDEDASEEEIILIM